MPAGEIHSAAEEHYSYSLGSLVPLNIQNGHHLNKTAMIPVRCFRFTKGLIVINVMCLFSEANIPTCQEQPR